MGAYAPFHIHKLISLWMCGSSTYTPSTCLNPKGQETKSWRGKKRRRKMEKIINIASRKVLEAVAASLKEGKRRGFVPLRGLEEEELQAVARVLRGLGLRAGIPPKKNGVWWAVRSKKDTKQKKSV
ncbi:MAG: hypothetical protein QW251_04100 [Desulfurococcaceae archaeon]